VRVVLTNDVPALGRRGAIEEVAEGYARNYLLPRGLAVPATRQATTAVAAAAARRERAVERSAVELERLAQQLDSRRFELRAKANELGTLFAGVTAAAVSGILHAAGYDVSPQMIELAAPIKQVGEHRVALNLGRSGRAAVALTVVAETAARSRAAARLASDRPRSA
jgi:large subunit ribosomal protein L9